MVAGNVGGWDRRPASKQASDRVAYLLCPACGALMSSALGCSSCRVAATDLQIDENTHGVASKRRRGKAFRTDLHDALRRLPPSP